MPDAARPAPDERRPVERRNGWWWVVPAVLAGIFVFLWLSGLRTSLQLPPDIPARRGLLAGSQSVQVPAVIGLTGREAYTKLETSGFKITTVAGENVVVANARVTAQDPAGGTMAPVASTVTIEFGGGESNNAPASALGLPSAGDTVPNVVRSSEINAVTTLEGAGYKVSVEHRSGTSAVVKSDTVLSQSPAAGTEVPLGQTVSIVVWVGQTGQRMLDAPDVLGLSVSRAREKVESAGFKFQPFERPQLTGGIVRDQYPAPGDPLLSGGTVSVTYGY